MDYIEKLRKRDEYIGTNCPQIKHRYCLEVENVCGGALKAQHISAQRQRLGYGIYAHPLAPCKGNIFISNNLCRPYRALGWYVRYSVGRCPTLNDVGLSALFLLTLLIASKMKQSQIVSV